MVYVAAFSCAGLWSILGEETMDRIVENELKQQIDRAEVVSFDVFDTLLLRRLSHPEDVFDIVAERVKEPDFKQQRRAAQTRASDRVIRDEKRPHANLEEIYEELGKIYGKDKSAEAMSAELDAENDALYGNPELKAVYDYAVSRHKRVIAVTDMYLSARQIEEFLRKSGYKDIAKVYCSADLGKAKFNEQIFPEVLREENIKPQEMLHIGDSRLHDYEFPRKLGIRTFLYSPEKSTAECDAVYGTDDLLLGAVYRSLYKKSRGFWYNLGVRVGGPVYLGLYLWLRKLGVLKSERLYLLSRDGYNLWKLLGKLGYKNARYVETSRRALLLAGMTEINDENLQQLPPFTFNQTIRDILRFMNLPADRIKGLEECGFSGPDDRIRDLTDMENFKKLYAINSDVFLSVCERERKNAAAYLKSLGLADSNNAVFFDCGWSGSSQYLLEKLLKAAGKPCLTDFYYFGIKKSQKAASQLSGKSFKTYAFGPDQDTDELERIVNESTVVAELFFSAPQSSVKCYSDEAKPVFDDDSFNQNNELLADGIADFVSAALPLVEKFGIRVTPEMSLHALRHLIENPSERESIEIGNIKDFDSWTVEDSNTKYVGYITRKQFDEHLAEIYWPQGIFRRPDVPAELKKKVAEKFGLAWNPPAVRYNLEDFQSIANYHKFLREKCARQDEAAPVISNGPAFSVVMPVYNTIEEQLTAAVDSVLSQTYKNFELILVDDCSSWKNVRPFLEKISENNHVKVIFREKNGGISEATNTGLQKASGDFIVFMDCDDTIENNALQEFASEIIRHPDADFIYSDEDKITEDGKLRHMPFFKPDWSPDLFLSMMYTNHLSAFRRSIVTKTGGLRTEYNGAQDYDFLLRFTEHTEPKRIRHIPKVLYHWRERSQSISQSMSAKSNVPLTTKLLKEDYLKRNGISGYAEEIPGIGQYRVVYNVSGKPLVSIIIPSKDNPELIKKGVGSIIKRTSYKNYEIIVVDNGSNARNREAVSSFLKKHGCRYVYEKADFNFSGMCNTGAKAAKGDFLLFLNDDIEIIQDDWLSRMLGACQQKHIGAVGAKLYYPESTLIQHAGISNIFEGPSHNFLRWDDRSPSYFAFNWIEYDCASVTGACLMVSAANFHAAGCFNEDLPVAYNDVDLCYRLVERGLYNVVRNDVCCYHHESYSRGSDEADKKKHERQLAEMKKLYDLHPEFLHRDPFLNPNIRFYSVPLMFSGVDNASAVEVQQIKDRYNVSEPLPPGEYRKKLKPVDKAILKLLGFTAPEGWAHQAILKNSYVQKRLHKIESRTGRRLWERRDFEHFDCPLDAPNFRKQNKFCCYIDSFSFERKTNVVSFTGWCIFRGIPSDEGRLSFIVKTGGRFVRLPLEVVLRHDVTQSVADGISYDKAGFFAGQNLSGSVLEGKFSPRKAFLYYEHDEIKVLIPLVRCAHGDNVVF